MSDSVIIAGFLSGWGGLAEGVSITTPAGVKSGHRPSRSDAVGALDARWWRDSPRISQTATAGEELVTGEPCRLDAVTSFVYSGTSAGPQPVDRAGAGRFVLGCGR